MKRVARVGLAGRQITELTPETEADLEELRKLDEQGLLDTRDSFGDDPSAWLPTEDTVGPPPPRRRSRRSA